MVQGVQGVGGSGPVYDPNDHSSTKNKVENDLDRIADEIARLMEQSKTHGGALPEDLDKMEKALKDLETDFNNLSPKDQAKYTNVLDALQECGLVNYHQEGEGYILQYNGDNKSKDEQWDMIFTPFKRTQGDWYEWPQLDDLVKAQKPYGAHII